MQRQGKMIKKKSIALAAGWISINHCKKAYSTNRLDPTLILTAVTVIKFSKLIAYRRKDEKENHLFASSLIILGC